MTILELIQKTTSFFEKAGVPQARLDVELLLAHVLGLRRMDLYMQFERQLTEPELNRLRPLVKRRAAREPLQHLTGSVGFHGLDLKVGPQALIPRHETELLVQKVIEFVRGKAAPSILDVGTGTGAIALAVAQAVADARVVGIDLSSAALGLARENADRAGLSNRVEWREGSLFTPLAAGESFQVIVSNPPYVTSAEMAELQAEVKYDPVLALEAGADGLSVIGPLVANASAFLKPGGLLAIEMGWKQGEAVFKLMETAGLTNVSIGDDLQGRPRFATGRKALG